MKKVISFIIIAFMAIPAFGQVFDGYKYVYVDVITYNSGEKDVYGITSSLNNNFSKKGFIVLSLNTDNWPEEARGNPCLVMFCSPSNPYNNINSKVGITITNCRNEIIFDKDALSINWIDDFQDNVNRALKNCLVSLDKISYHFDESKTPELKLPQVEITDETEASIKEYLSSNKLDKIEGIYKSYQDANYYKFGIIKQNDVFKAIIIESNFKHWKQGEVKAIFEPSSKKDFYSVKWYGGDKTSIETFSSIDNDVILSVELKSSNTNEKLQNKFIKIFPTASDNIFKTVSKKIPKTTTKKISSTASEKSLAQKNTKIENKPNIENSSDVDINIPVNTQINNKTFVVIIANENYTREVKVEYASNDGKIFKQYCEKTLGIPSKNIHLLQDATFGTMKSEIKWLTDIINVFDGQAKVIFYYAGHGMPNEQDKSAYLLPVDGFSSDYETAIKLDDLYSRLATSPSQNITIFLDACFSGSNRDNGMLANARGVKIKPKETMIPGNIVVFSAATGDETAYPYSEKQHGLFTYFLLKELQQTKGECSFKSLSNYINENVKQQSIVVNQKSQTPTIIASPAVQNSWEMMKLK